VGDDVMAPINIVVKAVAAGVTRKQRLKLALHLMPKITGDDLTEAAGFLEHWPARIQNCLNGSGGFNLAIEFRPNYASPDGRKYPKLILDHRGQQNFRSFNGLTSDVQKLWTTLADDMICGAKPRPDGKKYTVNDFFYCLAEIFREIPGDSTPFYIDKDKPRVLGVGRSDAAIFHLSQRLRRIEARLKSSQKKTDIADAEPKSDLTSWEDSDQKENPYNKSNTENLTRKLKEITEDNDKIVIDSINSFVSEPKSGSRFFNIGNPINSLLSQTIQGREKVFEELKCLHLAVLLKDFQPEDSSDRPKGALPRKDVSDLAKHAKEDELKLPVNASLDHVARVFVSSIRNSPVLARLLRFVVEVEVDLGDLLEFNVDPDFADLTTGENAMRQHAYAGIAATLNGPPAGDEIEAIAPLTLAKATRTAAGKLTGFWPVTCEEFDARIENPSAKMVELRKNNTISQVDGVLDLGQSSSQSCYNPRFDIISVDPVVAMEAAIRNADLALEAANSAKRLEQSKGAQTRVEPRSAFQNEQAIGIVNRGLSIVDRWRARAVREEIELSERHRREPKKRLILDADDLMIGYRIDVALRKGPNDVAEWRSLMEREIDYRIPGQEASANDDFRKWFKALSLPGAPDGKDRKQTDTNFVFEHSDRRNLDEGIMAPTARRRIIAPGAEMIHAEEVIAGWEGDPLGLGCGSDTVWVRPGADLAISRMYDLPREEDENAWKAWPLRYGWAYRFGIRPVWLGGVSLPRQGEAAEKALAVAEAEERYGRAENTGYANLALPGARGFSFRKSTDAALGSDVLRSLGWRRFLRNEAILPPVALLPRGIAEQSLPSAQVSTHLGPQSGVRVILRTLNPEGRQNAIDKDGFENFRKPTDNRETPITSRIILPPRVSLDEAIRHGVFDTMEAAKLGAVPLGDYRYIDFQVDAPPTVQPAPAAARPPGPTAAKKTLRTGFPAIKLDFALGELGGSDESASEPYFSLLKAPRDKTQSLNVISQYYADPMADRLIVAIRPNNNSPGVGYFSGALAVFDVKQAGKRTEPLPVKLVFKQRPGLRADGLVTQQSFWEKDQGALGQISDVAELSAVSGATIAGLSGVILLYPGESVDVDCWYAPYPENLRAYWEWPETMAAMKGQEVAPDPASTRKRYLEDIMRKLHAPLPDPAAPAPAPVVPPTTLPQASSKLLDGYLAQPGWVGFGGLPVFPAIVAEAARMMEAHLLKAPIPEIAAVRTIDAVHAVAKPPRAPRFDVQSKLEVFRSRTDSTKSKQAELLNKIKDIPKEIEALSIKPDEASKRKLDQAKEKLDQLRFGAPDDDGIFLTGTVEMDRDSCRQLEIMAYCIPPSRVALDDIRLGRTELQRLLGEWPDRVIPEGAVEVIDPKLKVSATDRAQEIGLSKSARFLFGFEVGLDGSVALPKRWTPILQIDDLQERDKKSQFNGLESIDLLDELIRLATATPAQREKEKKGDLRSSGLDRYSDKLARQFIVALRATSRFDPYFMRLDREAERPLTDVAFPPDPADAELIRIRSYAGADRDIAKTIREKGASLVLRKLWAPATVAPAKPQVHTVLPAFDIVSPEEPAPGASVVSWRYVRKPRIRVYLDRPWFTSGEGERLGVILWPPQLARTSVKDDQIARNALHGANSPDVGKMDLHDFVDDQLGPGGKFTTRWGADPIRLNEAPLGHFLPWQALAATGGAIPLEEPEENGVGYVPSIAIPLTDIREEKPTGDHTKSGAGLETLQAGLLTFVPKFDVETEKWFVDIALDPQKMMEPFVRLGLVRYQAHAAPALRVSAPVAVWSQVAPVRTVEITATPATDDVPARLSVQITGHASPREDEQGKPVMPDMHISLIETFDTPAKVKAAAAVKVISEEDLAGGPKDLVLAKISPPSLTGLWSAGHAWTARLQLPQGSARESNTAELNSAKPNPSKLISVLIEETETFVSTANEASNPLPEGETKIQPQIVTGGPRFLARIDLVGYLR
jgi:hypothetical protein